MFPVKYRPQLKPQSDIRNTVKDIYNISLLVSELQQMKTHLIRCTTEAEKTKEEALTTLKKAQELIERTKAVAKGDKGDKPIAGRDYPLPANGKNADENRIKESILSEFLRLVPSEDIVVRKAAKLVLANIKIEKPKDGKSLKIEDVLGAVGKHIEEGKIKLKGQHIEGWQDPETLLARFHARGGIRGGGDTVTAGSNITITTNANGNKVIASSGGSGDTVETPVGTVDASNTTFTVSATPTRIVSDGITYYENFGYTLSGLTVTMDVAPSQYIRSYS